jgi:hypothetical protein
LFHSCFNMDRFADHCSEMVRGESIALADLNGRGSSNDRI